MGFGGRRLRFFLVFSVLFCSSFVFTSVRAGAQCSSITSSASGVWSDTATWNTQVPASCNSVTIQSGHTVTIDIQTASARSLIINGTLSSSRVASSSLTMVGGDITVNSGGTLDMGTQGSPIPSNVQAYLVLAYGTSPGLYGLIVNNGGSFFVWGAAKNPVGLSLTDIQGGVDTSLQVSAAESLGWSVGDKITIGPTQGSGVSSTERRTITNITGSNPKTLSWSGALSASRTASYGVRVGNLTRNVVVRSSGTDTAGNSAYIRNLSQTASNFSVSYGEFAYLGANASGKYGITFDGAGVKGSISSSTVREGSHGIFLQNSGSNRFSFNLLYNNQVNGITIVGLGSNQNVLEYNEAYSNASYGITFAGSSSSNTAASNYCFSNLGGIYLTASSANLLALNHLFSNGGAGVPFGIALDNGINNTLVSNFVYSNSLRGIFVFMNTSRAVFADGSLGYDFYGNPRLDNPEISFGGSGARGLILKNSRLNALGGVSVTNLDVEDTYLLSYNQDSDSGTVRLWGDYTVSGSTFSLDYSGYIYVSTATIPKLMQGSGHSLSNVTTSDSNTLSEYVTATHLGSNSWEVKGSRSGVLGTLTCAPSSSCSFASSKISFTLNAGSSNGNGDFLDFATLSSSQDQNRQKKLLVGNSAPTFRGGRSKLTIAPSGGFSLTGTASSPGLMDRLDSSSTYYTFVDSGGFTLAFSTVTNADEMGLQLSGGGSISLATSTFDLAGQGNSSTGTYLTLRDLSNQSTFYGLVFANSRSNGNLYNIRVAGSDSGLNGMIRNWNGARGGEDFDDDPNNKILWGPTPADIIDLAAVPVTSAEDRAQMTWTVPSGYANVGPPFTYEIRTSTNLIEDASFAVAALWKAARPVGGAPGSIEAETVTGLSPATTYYFAMKNRDVSSNISGLSNVASYLTGKDFIPTVASHTPASDFFGVSLSTVIQVQFSKVMTSTTFNTGFLLKALRDNNGNSLNQAVSGNLVYSSSTKILSYTPSSNLSKNHTYQVQLTTDCKDLLGIPMSSSVTWQFATVFDYTASNTLITSEGMILVFPAGTFSQDGYLSVSTGVQSASVQVANQKLLSLDRFKSPVKTIEIEARTSAGVALPAGSEITMTVPYGDSNQDGYVDGMNPLVREGTLALWWLDENLRNWVRIPRGAVNASDNTFTAPLPHLSTFALIGGLDSSLSSVFAYPVPYIPSKQSTRSITFQNLSSRATIRIFTVSGDLVTTIEETDGDGRTAWDVKNHKGQDVASGLYIYLIQNGSEKFKGELIVVK
ncbi:MAG: Ig-like domain-containing protein [Elusimicrobia bacterium]|nr:Ig-like domain-containing protein [Elusimicrobiota bacterium]